VGEKLFQAAVSLRQSIYDINASFAAGGQPNDSSIDVLTRQHADSLSKARLAHRSDQYAWVWSYEDGLAAAVLGPIAEAAVSLMIQQDSSRIKQCKGSCCGWLFFDATKNNSRRWCEMSICGNRSKIKALRARKGRPAS
jgi:predicted RNA-binding Zn ribbon-like protein